MSQCKAKALHPEEIEFKFEITFKLSEWILIKDSFDRDWCYPMSDLASNIADCVNQVEKVYIPSKSVPE